tara:strand:- start:2701 stop:3561 length:861 start_codon:yes stop_codon:yes gene_type:complete
VKKKRGINNKKISSIKKIVNHRGGKLTSRKEWLLSLDKSYTKQKIEEFLKKPDFNRVRLFSGSKDIFVNIPSGVDIFNYAVAEPMSFKNKKPNKEWFDGIIEVCYQLIFKSKFQYTTQKDLKSVIRKINSLSKVLFETGLAGSMDSLDRQLLDAEDQLVTYHNSRKNYIKPSLMKKEIALITKQLERYWQLIVKDNEKINAYSKGNAYDKLQTKAQKDKKGYQEARKNLDKIDVKYNPGGAFIQRTLKYYFNEEFNNRQLARLLKEAHEINADKLIKSLGQKLSKK